MHGCVLRSAGQQQFKDPGEPGVFRRAPPPPTYTQVCAQSSWASSKTTHTPSYGKSCVCVRERVYMCAHMCTSRVRGRDTHIPCFSRYTRTHPASSWVIHTHTLRVRCCRSLVCVREKGRVCEKTCLCTEFVGKFTHTHTRAHVYTLHFRCCLMVSLVCV